MGQYVPWGFSHNNKIFVVSHENRCMTAVCAEGKKKKKIT